MRRLERDRQPSPLSPDLSGNVMVRLQFCHNGPLNESDAQKFRSASDVRTIENPRQIMVGILLGLSCGSLLVWMIWLLAFESGNSFVIGLTDLVFGRSDLPNLTPP